MVYELSNHVTKTLITKLRDQKSDAVRFRHIVREITKQLVYEAFKEEPMVQKSIVSWRGKESYDVIDEDNMVVATVLRAGMPMLDSAVELLGGVSAGFLAMKRDETTHESVLYYDRLPECKGKTVVLVDPMVATGGSMIDAINLIKKREPSKIITLNIIGSPDGLERVSSQFPDVDIYIAQIDERLNSDKFIIPGLGDAGDRSYNTVKQ